MILSPEQKEQLKQANPIKHQVGGDHYLKMKIQPWDVIDANGMDFYEGTAITYLMRWKDKNGVEDLRKCIHTIERIIAREVENEKIGNKEAGRPVESPCARESRA